MFESLLCLLPLELKLTSISDESSPSYFCSALYPSTPLAQGITFWGCLSIHVCKCICTWVHASQCCVWQRCNLQNRLNLILFISERTALILWKSVRLIHFDWVCWWYKTKAMWRKSAFKAAILQWNSVKNTQMQRCKLSVVTQLVSRPGWHSVVRWCLLKLVVCISWCWQHRAAC